MKILRYILLYFIWLLWLLCIFLYPIATIVLTLLIVALSVVWTTISVLYAIQAVYRSKVKAQDYPYKEWTEQYKDKLKDISDEQEKLDMYESYLLHLTLMEK